MKNKKLMKRRACQNVDFSEQNDEIMYFPNGVKQTIVTEPYLVPIQKSVWQSILEHYMMCGE